ncbi:eukaryotic membrane protein family-domain-containing protein [Phialemonium atrogriseum]|uniref:Eukaryotic membrane protein family-domain-containing protein n=1 Tax=Phialemonium atrogriseum TaxID=1093897 RepID=A0AAJ0C8H1_9PEZI|nr:eukaryotic membrane protein family-domain-containing protein [Phialemonium atrogriseum]KAK1771895.1 eukaryotic membrane protein family-domain-containing protein [Phialemonium atrogriseum]
MEGIANDDGQEAGLPPMPASTSTNAMQTSRAQLPKMAAMNGIEGRPGAYLPSPLLTPTDQSPNPSPPPPDSPSMQENNTMGNGQAASLSMDAYGDGTRKTRSRSGTKTRAGEGVRRLSASQMQELTAAPDSLPIASISDHPPPQRQQPLSAGFAETICRQPIQPTGRDRTDTVSSDGANPRATRPPRPRIPLRTLSTPPTGRRKSTSQPPTDPSAKRRNSANHTPHPPPLNLAARGSLPPATAQMAARARPDANDPPPPPSPIPPTIPLPPMSIPTVLQLELAAQRPSPLYIHHSYASDLPYESSAIKFERLKNFLLLPSYFERTMNFGVLACLDAWLWTFTILPMRFFGALGVLVRWWGYLIRKEVHWLLVFVWSGLGRLWTRTRRGRHSSRRASNVSAGSSATEESRSRSRSHGAFANGTGFAAAGNGPDGQTRHRMDNARLNNGNGETRGPKKQASKSQQSAFRHRRTKSVPSTLSSVHKADLLQGAVIICSSIFLMNLDASRMYHFIRAQSAMKLYVIYNVLEVSDRLLSALGQDIFECLFSSETLSRNSSGRSKILLPFGMFLLSLTYNTLHSVVLFYQVTTLNVAVNSYSNALLTLLISNQFVEIKSSVFKRFEKENTFQLTCADIVERFQMWIMLLIIGMRNVVEVGGLSVPGAGTETGGDDPTSRVPLHSASVLPASFTIVPSWLLSGEVLSPFLIVIGSEMIVDWIKHAYINKFNNIRPTLYSRILDILSKDYYTSAFAAPSLTRRLGLPLIPLSCLFIRASVQTYNMFLATHLPAPPLPSTQTSLSVGSTPTPSSSSPAVVSALDRLDTIIRSALGRAVHGDPQQQHHHDHHHPSNGTGTVGTGSILPAWARWTSDDAVAAVTMVVVFLLVFLALLVVKLVLGMALLRYSRDRYARMKVREHAVAQGREPPLPSDEARGKRVGGHGEVETGEERRRWIYAEDAEGLRKARAKERRAERGPERERDIDKIVRYEMVAKRIW